MANKSFGPTFANVVGMGVHHGISIASWKMIVSLGSIFAFNMGALTFFDVEKERPFYLFALMSLIGLTAVFIWRKLRKRAFIQSVIDLNGLLDDRYCSDDVMNDVETRGLLFKQSKDMSEDLVHVSDSIAVCKIERFNLVRPHTRSPAEYELRGKGYAETYDSPSKSINVVLLSDFGDAIENSIFGLGNASLRIEETMKGNVQ